MTTISLRLAPLFAVALMLIVAGCSQDSGTQNANSGSSSGGSSSEASSEPTAKASEPIPPEPTPEPKGQYEPSCGGPPEETLDLQYRYINAGDYEAAYALFAEQSKALIPPGQYRDFFEENAPYSITDYSFPSSDVRGGAAMVGVSFTLNDDEGSETAAITQELVCEGAWRVAMRDAQVEALAEAGQETAQYEPGSRYESGNQFERFVGEWYRHGERLTINEDRTGTYLWRIYDHDACERRVGSVICNGRAGVRFEPASDGLTGVVTSSDYPTEYAEGDYFELEFIDEDLLRSSNGAGDLYHWCNSQQKSAENVGKCGA